ncbi:hypothetical protein ED92_24270 [Amycolatopsis sp. MJM2582]|uniref:hypothetical protein n=1 Tax=Amycolatopsis sp. MJM2582 TaxID=1427749 RepID=UPI0005080BAF|nr:hypothetical protein [Amycolatopsis sp. MJM2582]KFZ80476.1 hypothetical protein ED92_24270 [Amycolatopsis sp. MJM2582]
MDELENRLRGITLAEPPLGFDPDEVAGKAAKKARNRRGIVATSVATLAVIAAAVVFVAPGGGPAPLAPAASSQAAPKDPLQHLKDVMPKVLTGAKDIQVRDFVGFGDLKTSEVRYTDAEGRQRGVNLTIAGPVSTKDGYPRENRCDPAKRADAIGSDRKPTRCVELPQPDGNFVVISETAPKSAESDGDVILGQGFTTGRVVTRGAIAFPPGGGGSVNIADLGTLDDGDRGAPSLTDQQLLALVLDPAFAPR